MSDVESNGAANAPVEPGQQQSPSKAKQKPVRHPLAPAESRLVGRDSYTMMRHHLGVEVDGTVLLTEMELPSERDLALLEVTLRELARRRTYDVKREVANVIRETTSPKNVRGVVARLRELIPTALYAYWPGVIYPPLTGELLRLLFEEGDLEVGGPASRGDLWGAGLRTHIPRQVRFIGRLRDILRSVEVRQRVKLRVAQSENAQRSLNHMVNSLVSTCTGSVQVVAVDLYASRSASSRRQTDLWLGGGKEILDLLAARKRLSKKAFNSKKGLLSQVDYFMVPCVGAYARPYITAWIFVETGKHLTDMLLEREIKAQWALAAGENAFCKVYRNHPYGLRRSAPADALSIAEKQSLRTVRRGIRSLAGQLAWVIPDLPDGSRKFWRSERRHGDMRKKHDWSVDAQRQRKEAISERKASAEREIIEKLRVLREEEKQVPLDRVADTPAVDGGDFDISILCEQRKHSNALRESAAAEDRLIGLEAISRKQNELSKEVQRPEYIADASARPEQKNSKKIPVFMPDMPWAATTSLPLFKVQSRWEAIKFSEEECREFARRWSLVQNAQPILPTQPVFASQACGAETVITQEGEESPSAKMAVDDVRDRLGMLAVRLSSDDFLCDGSGQASRETDSQLDTDVLERARARAAKRLADC